MSSFDLDPLDRFTAGAVGEPGQRVFYLQAAAPGSAPVSFKLEKAQVAALAGYLAQLLSDLPTPEPGDDPTPIDLDEPVIAEWVVGPIAVAYDPDSGRFEVRLEELVEDDDVEEDDDLDDLDTVRLVLSRGQAQGFVVRAAQLVAAGRPPCPLCGRPVDAEGHMCPKTNGHSH